MMEIEILNLNHIEEIKELWQELNEHHRKLSTHFKDHFATFTFNQRIQNLIGKEKYSVFLARADESKIGYCIASYDKETGEIDSIYIKPESRGKGLGRILMTEAMHWLEKQKCKDIRVYIADGNENVKSFYRKFGFAERFSVMQIKRSSPHNY